MVFFKRKKKKESKREKKNVIKDLNRDVSNAKTEQSSADEEDQHDEPVTTKTELSDVPRILNEISKGPKAAPRALRQLFEISDLKPNQVSLRVEMVAENKRLIPILLEFLQNCEFGSSEQYLTLLVLNNLSIPKSNKRLIAIEYGGASILSNMLCKDVSCHLMSIILVNLSFSDSELRRDLSLVLLSPLTFVLQEACKTEETEHTDYNSEGLLFAYPETAKWVCAAIKNLTRPALSGEGCQQGVDLLPLLQQIVTFPSSPSSPIIAPKSFASANNLESCRTRSSIQSVNSFPEAGPTLWETNSLQDAALFCLLHLSISCGPILMSKCVPTLESIANYKSHSCSVLDFQRLKARMALSYLIGSTTNTNDGNKAKKMLQLSNSESRLLVECLHNTLNNNAHPERLYSAATFSVKWILYAIRNLLPLNGAMLNQQTTLNSRLLHALSEHSLSRSTSVDANAAEYAAIALHLLSTHGLEDAFYFECENQTVVKILNAYLPRASEDGKYAARQVLLRLSHLQTVRVEDTSDALRLIARMAPVEYEAGAAPQSNILHKPILAYHSATKERRLYSSAMHAVQDGIRADDMDEIHMANYIATAADSRANVYHHVWSWVEDETVVEVGNGNVRRNEDGPMSLFGLSCGPMFCASSTKHAVS
eukprot:CAMPEP_0194138912 /NCGR_PEP_ID=MMETSP0152-20130528/8650_1 /TAXON_ID=1049557 /ORGANISM="Thalassiothrix antarctica, Strain L6-D1" /LENGTH=651 /DNA_ID=CAMNT_0038836565 /DNA_START=68 /DNA_END=2023 /DNA_ORIENTATION=+